MSDSERRGYLEPPAIGSETATLLGSLERQRATFEWKTAGLDESGLAQRHPPSELTLGRLLKHLAYMEDLNFTRDLGGLGLPEEWELAPDPDTRSALVFTSADDDDAETLYRLWHEAVARSRVVVRQALTAGGPDATYRVGEHELTVRRLLVDMIEEYGRHTGHADLLREALDGRVGEDPPGPAVPYEG